MEGEMSEVSKDMHPQKPGLLNKVLCRRLRPEVQPPTFYIPFLRVKAPLSHTLY